MLYRGTEVLGEVYVPTQVIRKLKGDIVETAADVRVFNEKKSFR